MARHVAHRRDQAHHDTGQVLANVDMPGIESADNRKAYQGRRHERERSMSPLEIYLRDVNEVPLLNAEDERRLGNAIQHGSEPERTEARETMIRANLRLVVNIARGYVGRGMPLQDLIEEGNLGLMRAVEGFKPDAGTRFSTYGSYWIKQSIKRALTNEANPIRVPAHMVELMGKHYRAQLDLADKMPKATPKEIHDAACKALGLSKAKIKLLEKGIRAKMMGRLRDPITDETSSIEGIADERHATEEGVHTRDAIRHMQRRLEELDEREATVLRLRFGLGGATPKTLREIGENLGLTRERVRQIENEALEKLASQGTF